MKSKEVRLKKTLKGVVVSNKMQKTAVVLVERYKKHPKYGKYQSISKRFKAHDEKNDCAIGDEVIIEETAPISKDKTFIIKEIVKKTAK